MVGLAREIKSMPGRTRFQPLPGRHVLNPLGLLAGLEGGEPPSETSACTSGERALLLRGEYPAGGAEGSAGGGDGGGDGEVSTVRILFASFGLLIPAGSPGARRNWRQSGEALRDRVVHLSGLAAEVPRGFRDSLSSRLAEVLRALGPG